MTEDAVNDAVFRPVKSETKQTPFGLPGTLLVTARIKPPRWVEDPAHCFLAPGARLALVQQRPQGRTQHPYFHGSNGSTDKHEPWFPETKLTRLLLPIPGGTCMYIIEPYTLSHEDLTIVTQIFKTSHEFVQSGESHLDNGGAESFCRSEEGFHITNRVEGAANHLLVESHGDTLVPVCPPI